MEEKKEKTTKTDMKEDNQRPSGLGYGGRDATEVTATNQEEE